MKKSAIVVGLVILIPIIILFLSTGNARTDVYLKSFSVDKKCNHMTIEVGVSSSAGYVRKMKQTSGSMNYYYTFYSTFGINSKLGAQDTFEIQLDNNVDEIYFYTGENGYKKVLEKDEQGDWIMVNEKENNTITVTHGSIQNVNRIFEFIENTKFDSTNPREDEIRLIIYTIEGDPIIEDVKFVMDEEESYYEVIIDTTQDKFGVPEVTTKKYDASLYTTAIIDEWEFGDVGLVALPEIGQFGICPIYREEKSFIATIVEAYNSFIIVEPEEGTQERKSSDKIAMEINRPTSGINDFYVVGNKVKITYNGNIAESYPAQIGAIKIELVK